MNEVDRCLTFLEFELESGQFEYVNLGEVRRFEIRGNDVHFVMKDLGGIDFYYVNESSIERAKEVVRSMFMRHILFRIEANGKE